MLYSTPRKPWLALLLSAIMPGLGQMYCGAFIRGICLLIFFCLAPLIIAAVTVALNDSVMLAGMALAALCALLIYAFALIDGYLLAKQRSDNYQPQLYNTPIFYIAAWLAAFALMFTADQYIRENIVQAFKIVTASMSPTVLKGDYVLADKTAYRNHPVRKGDIIIVVYPDDRSKVLIRQVVALPGNTFTLLTGESLTVPHGTILIEDSLPGASALDSHTFGPVDMRDIVGKVTQVYFSKEHGDIRWQRIGTMIHP